MKYIVSSTLLYSRLTMVDRVILPKNSIQILSCFLFRVTGNTLEVTGTDNETTLRCLIPLSQTDGDFTFAVQAKQILDILKELPEQPLTIELNPTTLQMDLNYQNGHFALQAESADNYPEQKAGDSEKHNVVLKAPQLSEAFASAIVAAGNDDARKVMTGLFVDITAKDVSVVASDGHKLVCYKINADTHETTESFVLPRKPAALLRSIIEKLAGEIKMTTYENGNARFEAEGFIMDCRLWQEDFPNYKNVIPQNSQNIATIDRASLQSALKRMLVATDKGTQLIKFNFEPGRVLLSTENLNYAQSAEEKLVCQYEGIALRIGFRGDYLLELLNNVHTDDVLIKLNDPSRAGLVLPAEQQADTDLLMLLMPLLIVN